MQAKFDRGHTLLNKLENACLLESCKNRYGVIRCVKMHDLMREMALEITRRMSPRFMVKAGMQLHEIPDEQEWMEDLDKVSLMKNDFREEIPPGTAPRCPRLSTLLLSGNMSLMKIPYSFFLHMRALRVLDLSWTGIRDLPESISHLESLTALLLEGCIELEYVPPLGNLRALQVLNLSWTAIEEVPQGMEMLVNLNCLYMEKMTNKLTLPSGILPRLSHLQVLRLGSVRIVEVEELVELKLLEEFRGQLYDLCDLNRFVKSQSYMRWRIYDLIVGQNPPDFRESRYDKQVLIANCSLKGGEDGVLLPQDIQKLDIYGCHDINSYCDVLPLLNNARELKECFILWCRGMECILPLSFYNEIEGEESRCVPELQIVESLVLTYLDNLSGLIKWGRHGGERVIAPLPPATFSNLKSLQIGNCFQIKKLFPPVLLHHLQNLESIFVYGCSEMEEIIGAEEEGMGACSSSSSSNNSSTIFTLPKLKNLNLNNLQKLKSICKGVMACDSIEYIHLSWCPQLKRVSFSLPLFNGQPSPPHTLKRIVIHDQGWWESLEWDHPNAKNVLQPFVEW